MSAERRKMNENPEAADWIAARGRKWRANLPGTEAMLAPIDEPLLAALRLDAPCRIAEVGSGGGGTALKVLRRAPAGSVVHGFDISPTLVAAARERVPPGEQALSFTVADMEAAVPERPYDRLMSRFGVMFFADPQSAFRNLLRWLAPGGRFTFAVWGPAAENRWSSAVREVVARHVALPAPDPTAPGPFRYAQVGELSGLLERAGFSEIEARGWRGSIPIGGQRSPAEAAQFALSSFSSFGEILAEAGAGAVEGARRALAERFLASHRDGAVWMEASVHLVTGARP